MMHDIPDLDVEAVTQLGHQAPVPQQAQARQDQVRPTVSILTIFPAVQFPEVIAFFRFPSPS